MLFSWKNVKSRLSPALIRAAVYVLSAIIAVTDLKAPANVDVGIFYFVPIVLNMWTR